MKTAPSARWIMSAFVAASLSCSLLAACDPAGQAGSAGSPDDGSDDVSVISEAVPAGNPAGDVAAVRGSRVADRAAFAVGSVVGQLPVPADESMVAGGRFFGAVSFGGSTDMPQVSIVNMEVYPVGSGPNPVEWTSDELGPPSGSWTVDVNGSPVDVLHYTSSIAGGVTNVSMIAGQSDGFEFRVLVYCDDQNEADRVVSSVYAMFIIGGSVQRVGIDALVAVDENAKSALSFRGFDFNDRREGRLAGYAAHVIRNGRWTELAVHFDDQHERGNSHSPVLGSYLRMLAVFRPLWEDMVHGVNRGRYHLTEAELLSIVKAWPYPR